MPYFGVTPAAEFTSKDLDGKELILDADADTTITADTDDQIDIRIAGADDFQFTANTFTVLSGSTLAVASGATIANSGTSTGFSASTLAAATTVGDGTAEDTKIVFDGNAQDYYMGLDDTDDDFKIGLGSAVGTTAHMVFDEAGIITKPLQPAFGVWPASEQTNIAVDTAVDIVWGNELYDNGANFATPSFTAPVTGKYQLNVSLYFAQMQIDSTYYNLRLVTSNRTYYSLFNSSGFDTTSYQTITLAALADMDAGDTAKVVIYIAGGTAGGDVPANNSTFSGFLAT